MSSDFEHAIQKWFRQRINQVSAAHDLTARIGPDGAIYYDYSSASEEAILNDVGSMLTPLEQRLEAAQALVARLQTTVLDEPAADKLRTHLVTFQSQWIDTGANLLSHKEERKEALEVLRLLHGIQSLSSTLSLESSAAGSSPHQKLFKQFEAFWQDTVANQWGLETEESLQNAREALQFISQAKTLVNK